jgi:glycosyltransferase involved in cell wall biosynthesis
MPIYYSAAELLAYPLVYTGFGLSLLEASACGCVPVAFRLPPTTELVSDTAWLVDDITRRPSRRRSTPRCAIRRHSRRLATAYI